VKNLKDGTPERLAQASDVHYMAIPLHPSEEPSVAMVAQEAVKSWSHLPAVLERLKQATCTIEQWDDVNWPGGRVLLVVFKRWPNDPPDPERAQLDRDLAEKLKQLVT